MFIFLSLHILLEERLLLDFIDFHFIMTLFQINFFMDLSYVSKFVKGRK